MRNPFLRACVSRYPCPVTGPTLHTPRLTLAPHAATDLEDCAALWADPRVTEHLGGRPLIREEVWRDIQRHVGHWALFGWGYFVVREAASAAFLGEAGLMDSRRDTRPGFEGAPEAGWAFAPAAGGRGFAREAAVALLAWADGQGVARTVCLIDPANARSLRLAAAVGYGPPTDCSYRGEPTLLLERRAG